LWPISFDGFGDLLRRAILQKKKPFKRLMLWLFVYLVELFWAFAQSLPILVVHQIKRVMNITFEELRRIKHALPTGSIARIAKDLHIDEQTVRNYFGAHNYREGQIVEWHLEPGPNGGIVRLSDTAILDRALKILDATRATS
jgi:hypothetical protein